MDWGDAYAADGSLIPLPHPNETDTLRELGVEEDQACSEMRYVRLHARVCNACGTLSRKRQYPFFPAEPSRRSLNRVAYPLIFVVTLVMLWSDLGICLAMPLFIALLPIAYSAVLWMQRRRAAWRMPRVPKLVCSKCGGSSFGPLDYHAPIQCPLCEQGKVTWAEVWIS